MSIIDHVTIIDHVKIKLFYNLLDGKTLVKIEITVQNIALFILLSLIHNLIGEMVCVSKFGTFWCG